MRAVNLIPSDYRGGRGQGRGSGSLATYAVLGVLAAALGLVTVYVVTSNSVADQKAKLQGLQQQLPQLQAEADQLAPYVQFAALAGERAQTVQQIAGTRFDWAASLDQLSKVVPANTSLSSLTASTSTSSGTGTGTGGAGFRNALNGPAIELHGCTGSQDDVARLMSRLRLMTGVVRVSLTDAGQASSSGPAPGASASPGASSAAGVCAHGSKFDLVVFLQAPPGAAAGAPGQTGSAPAAPGPAPASSTAASQPPAATPGGTR